MHTLVTGAAGFVGSNLTDALLAAGHSVVAVDALTPYYDPASKVANLVDARARPNCEFVEADLRSADLVALLDGVDVVFHQAGQPGVRHSWSDGFAEYDGCNVLATQRLLEAARTACPDRFVFASSSSVYGNAASYPVREDDLPQPHSPYGVTKLAAEHLCGLYAANHAVPTVSLRYFTVYGPRQRPDMSMHRIIEAGLAEEPFTVYGTGEQIRDFTYVGDIVGANIAAAVADPAPGTVVNIAGGSSTTVNHVVDTVGGLLDTPVKVEHVAARPGDVDRTGASIDSARVVLGWEPEVALADGLAAQVEWHRTRRA